MLSTATALIQATEDSVVDDDVMRLASFIINNRDVEKKQFANFIFEYACLIASNAVDKATKVLLTEEQLMELNSSVKELEEIGNEVLGNGK